MTDDSITSGFIRRWVAATTIGWLVGIPCVLLISAGAEAARVPHQFAIGLGMGLGVGFFQWRHARRAFAVSKWWFWWSAIGLAAPFAICDLARYTTDGGYLVAPTAIGGLIAGLGQSRTLGIRTLGKYLWIPSAVIAWAAAAGVTLFFAIPGHPSSGPQFLRQLLSLISGGVMLGFLTGAALMWLHRAEP